MDEDDRSRRGNGCRSSRRWRRGASRSLRPLTNCPNEELELRPGLHRGLRLTLELSDKGGDHPRQDSHQGDNDNRP